MTQDDPAVLEEVRAAFAAYEQALVTNDVETLQRLFRRDPRTIRYGIGEQLLGWDAIAAFRAARAAQDLARTLENTVVTAYGPDHAVASTEFVRAGRRGRQQQTWVRFPDEGWRVVAAHVSMLP